MADILSVALSPTIDISCDTRLVQPTRKLRTHNNRQHPGGGGVNVARVISVLGGNVELVYLSGGATGKVLQEFLAGCDMEQKQFESQQSTRIAFTVHEEETGQEYRFVPRGPQIDPEELTPVFQYMNGFGGRYIVASGSLPPGAPTDTYTQMADLALSKGIDFIFDTSGPALKHTLTNTSVFFVKPSIGELESMVGEKLDETNVRDAALEIVNRGAARYVGVTLGAKGAFLASAEGVMRLPARHVTVRSAVGAGDSFVGGVTWALSDGSSMENAFKFGIAAGAAAVQTIGSELCRKEDVVELFDAYKTDNAQFHVNQLKGNDN